MKGYLHILMTILFVGTTIQIGCSDDDSSDNDQPDSGQSTDTDSDTDTSTEDDSEMAECESELPSIDGVLAALKGLPIDEFFEESSKQLILRSPELVTEMGLSQTWGVGDDKLDDISDAYTRQTYELAEKILELLKVYEYGNLTYEQQISYDTFKWYLDDRLRDEEFIYHHYPITQMFQSVQYWLFGYFEDIHPVSTKQNALDFVTRLGQIENKLACLRERISLCEEAGIISLKFMIENVISNLGGIQPGSATYLTFYTALEDKLPDVEDMSEEEKQELLEEAEAVIEASVIPAFQDLIEVLEELLPNAPLDNGVWQLPDGDAFYAHTLAHHTTTEMTADEIHELGLQEVERIGLEMQVFFDELGYPDDEDLSELYGRVAEDGGYIEMLEVVSTYEGIIEQAEQSLDEAFDIFPEAEVIVVGGSSGGYYISGSLDGERPGAFYVWADGNLPYYIMPTFAYHEAIPGHHFQISIAQEEDLPSFRVGEFTAYVEGWALYAERLAKELGWYDSDIYGDLGRLQDEMLRAVRLVVDTGMHAKGWTYDECVTYMVENMGISQESAESSVSRYISWPAQAVSYKIGMLKLLELREKAQEELGDQYDLKEFHRTVILSGSVPLSILERIIQEYIDAK